jgi:hypothetical protein
MTDNTITVAVNHPSKSKRAWNRHSFYMSDQMAVVASRIAKKEQARTGRQVGAGQIIDRAMRRYVSELMAPDELTQLLNGHAND